MKASFLLCVAFFVERTSASWIQVLPGGAQQTATMYRMISYGLQSNVDFEGKVMFMDCFVLGGCAMACGASRTGWTNAQKASALPCYNQTGVSGRRLVHGGAALYSRPYGAWAPDMSALSTDWCDFTTMVSPATTALEATIALVTPPMFLECMVKPSDSSPFVKMQSAGFSGLIFVITPSIMTWSSLKMQYNEKNVVPAFPICHAGMNGKAKPTDQAFFLAPMRQALANTSITVRARCTDDKCDVCDLLNGTGSKFLFRFCGVLFLLLFFLSCRAANNMRKCSWAMYVVVVEGIICSGLRFVKAFDSPFLLNGNFNVGASLWLTWSDAPFAATTTLVTAAVWVKIIFGGSMSEKKLKIFNYIVTFLVGSLLIYLHYCVAGFPITVWWREFAPMPSSGINTSKKLRNFLSNPIAYVNIIFLVVFVLATIAALFKIAMAAKTAGGNSNLAKSLKRMMKWIISQIVGTTLFVVGFQLESKITQAEESYSLFNSFASRHFQTVGACFAGYGQVGALYFSSSSSSS